MTTNRANAVFSLLPEQRAPHRHAAAGKEEETSRQREKETKSSTGCWRSIARSFGRSVARSFGRSVARSLGRLVAQSRALSSSLRSSAVYLSLSRIAHTKLSALLLVVALVVFTACAKPKAAETHKAIPAAKVENPVKESDLATIKLTPEAEKRLGITLAPVERKLLAQTRTLAGEIVLPPDRVTVIAAPVGGTLTAGGQTPVVGATVQRGQTLFRITPYLAPERDLRVQIEREITAAQTRVDAARVRLTRAEALLAEGASSERAVQQAREEFDLATNDLKTAQARLARFDRAPLTADTSVTIAAPRDGVIQKVQANAGQAVPGGAPLVEIASYATVWLRVPVYVGELSSIARGQSVQVRPLDADTIAPARTARPVAAPPTADPVSETADLYFELNNSDGNLRPGQRLSVTLNTRGATEGLAVPWSAVLYDIHGGAWVYEQTAPHQFTRRRVEVNRVVGALAALTRGPALGAQIVTTGAAELFGTEFGAGK